jgi:hypothetical protein
MFKERIFRKSLTIQNFRILNPSEFDQIQEKKGKCLKQDAELVVQVFYSPRGYCCEIEQLSPIDTWDAEQYCRIEGINEENPEGDLLDHNFDTILAAMHFITRRLKKLGWDPLDAWSDS